MNGQGAASAAPAAVGAMMESVSFTIPGRVKGKGRPKFARRGNFVHAYTPADTANCEAMVRSLASLAMGGKKPFAGPLLLDITVTLNTPASWSKKAKASAFYATGKPDVDNQIKLIADAMNGVVYQDDKQISDVMFRRRYNDHAGESVEVKIMTPGCGEAESERLAA